MGCSCGKLKAQSRGSGPVRKPQKGDINLPPLTKLELNRPDDFGKLPAKLTEDSEDGQNDDKTNGSSAPMKYQQQEQSEVLVSRAFEMNQIMGHGFRFQTLTTFSVRQFHEKRDQEDQQDKCSK